MTTMLKLVCLIPAILITACSSDSKTPPQGNEGTSPSFNTTDQSLYGAEVFSHDKVLFGKFVIRMKMVSSPGVISSFFTYDNESWAGGIPWREIDIESVGKRADLLQTNLITGEASIVSTQSSSTLLMISMNFMNIRLSGHRTKLPGKLMA